MWHEDLADNVDQLVGVTCQHDSLGSQTDRADLRDDGVCNRADGNGVCEDPDEGNSCLCPQSSALVVCRGDGTNDDEQHTGRAFTEDVDRAAADSGRDEPGDDGTAESESSATKTDSEGLAGRDTCSSEEVGRRVGEGATGENLTAESHHGNLSTSEIGTAEAIPVLCAGSHLVLDLDGVDELSEGASGLSLSQFTQAVERALGFVQTVVADVVPGALRGEVDDDHQWYWPDPLDGEGNAVTPLRWVVDQTLEHTSCNELSHRPAQVDVHGEVATELQGHDLRCVGRTSGSEDTPCDT